MEQEKEQETALLEARHSNGLILLMLPISKVPPPPPPSTGEAGPLGVVDYCQRVAMLTRTIKYEIFKS